MFEATFPENLPEWPLALARQRYHDDHHGDFNQWVAAIKTLPEMTQRQVELSDTIAVTGHTDDQMLEQALQALHPWRKGPFRLGSIQIDTEWRSDWKWIRIADVLGDMSNQRVLDIGCGNGYFGWRMLAAGAREVVGIDPTLLFCMQHQAISHYIPGHQNWVIPLKIEEIPNTATFDVTLSMGVIYHRRDPLQHVQQLFDLTKPGGRCLIESIVVQTNEALIPENRYARMRNVWCVPRVEDLVLWLQQVGFSEVEIVDVSRTTTDEQRPTQWMRFESLAQTLDPENSDLTVEGHPAPVRAVVTAQRKS